MVLSSRSPGSGRFLFRRAFRGTFGKKPSRLIAACLGGTVLHRLQRMVQGEGISWEPMSRRAPYATVMTLHESVSRVKITLILGFGCFLRTKSNP